MSKIRVSLSPSLSISIFFDYPSYINIQEVGRGEFLSLVLSNLTSGRYTCLAQVEGFPTVTASAEVGENNIGFT